MRIVTIPVAAGRGGRIALGRRGENEAVRVVFDVTALADLYGEGTAELIAVRPGETAPYPVAAERDGSGVIWTVTNADTAIAGHGACELFWYVGNTLAKSVVYGTVIGRDIGDPGQEPPEAYATWVEQVLAVGAAGQNTSAAGPELEVSAETLAAGSAASVTKEIDPETGVLTLTFGIPQGAAGAAGAQGPQGEKGDKGDAGATGAQGPKGDTGATGAAGATGPAGPGVPSGGTAGQFLVKHSAADFDDEWKTPAASDVGAAPAVVEVTNTSTGAVTMALDAGKIYHFTGAVSSLTLTLTAAGAGVIPQYHFDFDSGSTAPTVTVTGVTWPGGSFTPEASKHYEVDTLNGYGVWLAW